MTAVKVAERVYWVGAVDWNIRQFHGPSYTTHQGTTYNSFLIMDDKKTLVDGVYAPFTGELIRHIREQMDPAALDYIVINHVEYDHSGALPEIKRLAPNARVFCSARAAESLKKMYFVDWDFNILKTGDTLSTGQRTLRFVEAPMLHWPDSMFTYLVEDQLLMPNDAFGQHLASAFRFDDEVDQAALMDEAAKYYANILYPFSALVLKKLDELSRLGISPRIIAPSHGVIWRANPGRIVEAYARWASGKAADRAVIIYDTMWESTTKLALAILDGLVDENVEGRVFKASACDRSDIIKEVLDAGAVLVGSSTINRDVLPPISPILDDLAGLKPGGKVGVAFGSHGWGGGAVKTIEERLKNAGVELMREGFTVKWVPTVEELADARELGRQVARAVRARK